MNHCHLPVYERSSIFVAIETLLKVTYGPHCLSKSVLIKSSFSNGHTQFWFSLECVIFGFKRSGFIGGAPLTEGELWLISSDAYRVVPSSLLSAISAPVWILTEHILIQYIETFLHFCMLWQEIIVTPALCKLGESQVILLCVYLSHFPQEKHW